ncbi:MAG: hypothetical protein QOJ30_5562 [Pseudonocardiales bacterium]|nr:hypothetical protein [Pseudonocardiales bacterium]
MAMRTATTPDYPVAILGAGFAGLGLAIRLKQQGRHDFVVLERASDVGGTWRENTYPGCQCDIPSALYSFSFAPNPNWTRLFPLQEEIWDYLRDCADRYGIRPHIRFDSEVTGADWDDERGFWRLTTSQGEITARVVVTGQGGLSEPAPPDIPGVDSFAGTMFHSAHWDHDHDLRGERIAVIGTGASAIQFIPYVQPEAAKLTLFQRTPPWIMPHPDRPMRPFERRLFRRLPVLQKLLRGAIYTFFESRVLPFTKKPDLMKAGERIALKHMREQIPHDPELRAKLTPGYRMGCKRILMSNTYYKALAQPNADVVTEPIAEIRPNAIVTADGVEHEVDTIIFGTGFKVADGMAQMGVTGRDGVKLVDAWKDGPEALLGTTVAGFPNLFMIVGPNTGLGHSSMVFMVESQINYVLDAMRTVDASRAVAIDTRQDSQDAYNADLQRRLGKTVWSTGGCASWYLDENGRNRTLWPGYTFSFRRRTKAIDPAHHELIA